MDYDPLKPMDPDSNNPWWSFRWCAGIVTGPNPTGDLGQVLYATGRDTEEQATEDARLLSLCIPDSECIIIPRGQLWTRGFRNGRETHYGFAPVLLIDTDNPEWPG